MGAVQNSGADFQQLFAFFLSFNQNRSGKFRDFFSNLPSNKDASVYAVYIFMVTIFGRID